MELLYIDESGDNGLVKGSTDYYILAGISFEDTKWKENFWKIADFRKNITQQYGIFINELKGSELFSHRGQFFNTALNPNDLERIYSQAIDLICSELNCNIFLEIRSKEKFKKRYTENKKLIKIFNSEIWGAFLSKFENHLITKSVKTGYSQTGIVYFDSNQHKYLRKLLRQFSRKFDQQSKFPSCGIIEDIVFRDSKNSYFIQFADILAFSFNRIITGKGKQDVFQLNPSIKNRLKEKLGEEIKFD